MKRGIQLLFAGAIVLSVAGPLFAHHSFGATYDSSQRLEIEGIVKELVWRNPHSFLRLDVTEKDGQTKTWALEWGSITQLSQAQITRTSLKPGDHIVVGGAPARDPSSSRLLIQTVKRPADGWVWQGKVE
jgi:hypothetical protein